MTLRSRRSGRALLSLGVLALALGPGPVGAQAPTRSLTLQEALRRGEEQSDAIHVARAGVDRADGEWLRARSYVFPQIGASAQFQRTLQSQFREILRRADAGGGSGGGGEPEENNPLAKIFGSDQQLTLGLQLQQPLFSGGRVSALTRIARATRRTADLNLAAARAQVQLDVAESYFDALLADRLLAIAEGSLGQMERTLEQVQLARTVGSTSEFELLRARVTRDNLRPVVLQRRAQRDLARIRLEQLLGTRLGDSLQLDTTALDGVPAAPDTASVRTAAAGVVTGSNGSQPDTSVDARTAVRQSAAAVEMQQQVVRLARAQRLPTLSLVSQYGRTAYPSDGVPPWSEFYPNWTVGVALQLPLFTGGRIRGDEMVARANAAEARARHQQVREAAELDARSVLAQLEEAEAAWAASEGTAEQAGRAHQIAEVRYTEGISTQLELVQARLLLQEALANRARAARDLHVARVRAALLPLLPLGTGGSFTGAGATPASVLPAAPAVPSRSSTPSSTAGAAGAMQDTQP